MTLDENGALVEHGNPRIERAHEMHVVIDDDQRRRLIDPLDDGDEPVGLGIGEAGRGLVEQNEPRLFGENGADLHQLALPVRELAHQPAFPSRTRVFTVTPRVLIDNNASGSHTVTEVNGRDRPGLLFELTRALTGLNLQVSSAKISTYGEKVVDVFYVKNLFGHKIEHSAKLAEIQRTLEVVLAKVNDPALTVIASREPAPAE